ncbi:hypothetical protein, partial [Nocardia wallacei]|uniref:hypothetical protein n=1 Tax=Nocardia wallacei TaxID=480035 RepID=UPI002454F039
MTESETPSGASGSEDIRRWRQGERRGAPQRGSAPDDRTGKAMTVNAITPLPVYPLTVLQY